MCICTHTHKVGKSEVTQKIMEVGSTKIIFQVILFILKVGNLFSTYLLYVCLWEQKFCVEFFIVLKILVINFLNNWLRQHLAALFMISE